MELISALSFYAHLIAVRGHRDTRVSSVAEDDNYSQGWPLGLGSAFHLGVGVGPSFSWVGVGPSFSLVGVGPSFSLVVVGLPVGVGHSCRVGPSFSIKGWGSPFQSGLVRRRLDPQGPIQKERRGRPGTAQKGKGGPGPTQEQRKGKARPDTKGRMGRPTIFLLQLCFKIEVLWRQRLLKLLNFEFGL